MNINSSLKAFIKACWANALPFSQPGINNTLPFCSLTGCRIVSYSNVGIIHLGSVQEPGLGLGPGGLGPGGLGLGLQTVSLVEVQGFFIPLSQLLQSLHGA